jgi:hypothetical protein
MPVQREVKVIIDTNILISYLIRKERSKTKMKKLPLLRRGIFSFFDLLAQAGGCLVRV